MNIRNMVRIKESLFRRNFLSTKISQKSHDNHISQYNLFRKILHHFFFFPTSSTCIPYNSVILTYVFSQRQVRRYCNSLFSYCNPQKTVKIIFKMTGEGLKLHSNSNFKVSRTVLFSNHSTRYRHSQEMGDNDGQP